MFMMVKEPAIGAGRTITRRIDERIEPKPKA